MLGKSCPENMNFKCTPTQCSDLFDHKMLKGDYGGAMGKEGQVGNLKLSSKDEE
jgi:hypothetical protein